MIAISLHQEYIARIGGFLISNSLFTAVLVSGLLILAAMATRYEPADLFSTNSFERGVEMIFEPLWNFVLGVLEHEDAARAAFPFIATFFIFIVSANFVEILPGFLGAFGLREGAEWLPLLRSPSTDLNTTIALALISVFITQVFVIRYSGFKKYISKFINFRSPIKALLGPFEALGEVSRILSFSFRLFGNMFAGSVMLILMGFLVPYLIPLPFMLLEVFVGLIQALIFSMLTLVFIKSALLH